MKHSRQISEQKKIRNDARVINVCFCKVTCKGLVRRNTGGTLLFMQPWQHHKNKVSVYWTEKLIAQFLLIIQEAKKKLEKTI